MDAAPQDVGAVTETSAEDMLVHATGTAAFLVHLTATDGVRFLSLRSICEPQVFDFLERQHTPRLMSCVIQLYIVQTLELALCPAKDILLGGRCWSLYDMLSECDRTEAQASHKVLAMSSHEGFTRLRLGISQ